MPPRIARSRCFGLTGVYAVTTVVALGAWAVGGLLADGHVWPLAPWPRGSERARVVRAIDGDTVLLEDGRSVRILGLDAPETLSPSLAAVQPLGAEAATRLAALVDGREVVLEHDTSEADHYGRLLRHVWVGRDLVAEMLVAEGLAWSNAVPPDIRHRERVRAAEERARNAGLGLWGLERPTPLAVFAAGDSVEGGE